MVKDQLMVPKIKAKNKFFIYVYVDKISEPVDKISAPDRLWLAMTMSKATCTIGRVSQHDNLPWK
jgi:hypothetical protein